MSFIIMPIFVLLHELGHAIPILFRTEQMVHIELGKSIGEKMFCNKTISAQNFYPSFYFYIWRMRG